jgi:hypothetical protein
MLDMKGSMSLNLDICVVEVGASFVPVLLN